MNKKDEFLKTQKIVRIATIGKNKTPHIAFTIILIKQIWATNRKNSGISQGIASKEENISTFTTSVSQKFIEIS